MTTSKEHLEIALGGNMHTSSLTTLAIEEIMTDFAKKYHKEQLILSGVGCSEITTNDIDKEFIVIRDDLVEIEKGSVLLLLEINSSGRHEFMDKSNDLYWFEADCVKRRK